MPNYLFSLGNSDTGPVGFCARINAATPERALARLLERLPESLQPRASEFDLEGPDEYINVYFNQEHINLDSIIEDETEDDEEEEQEEDHDA